jgi:hypothetical protein
MASLDKMAPKLAWTQFCGQIGFKPLPLTNCVTLDMPSTLPQASGAPTVSGEPDWTQSIVFYLYSLPHPSLSFPTL